MMRKIMWIIIVGLLAIGAVIGISRLANASPAPKFFVCKYVGKPGVDETLQTGNNPISVSGNALPEGTEVGDSFADAQGRSYVVALDSGQDEPECPVTDVPEEEPETPPVVVPPVVVPVVPPVEKPLAPMQGK